MMEMPVNCPQCGHVFEYNQGAKQSKANGEFSQFLTWSECPQCDHAFNYDEHHSCVAVSLGDGELRCGFCDNNMTPNNHYE